MRRELLCVMLRSLRLVPNDKKGHMPLDVHSLTSIPPSHFPVVTTQHLILCQNRIALLEATRCVSYIPTAAWYHWSNYNFPMSSSRCNAQPELEVLPCSGAVHDEGTTEPSSHLLDASCTGENHVIGCYKANTEEYAISLGIGRIKQQAADPPCLTDPNVGDEAKRRAQQALKDKDVL